MKVRGEVVQMRALEREIGARLLDVLPSTPPGPGADFSFQSA
jgi:hypothetical protein